MHSGKVGGRPKKAGIPIMRPSLPPLEDYVKRLRKIWSTRMLSNFGDNARELEEKAQNYLGNPHVRAASSCDTALMLGLASLQIPQGSECIVTAFTFNSTINAILWNGLRPRFTDVDPLTFNISPQGVEHAVTERTKAIVATHVFGNPCDIRELRRIADEHDLRLVFDAAHAYGTLYRGKKVGSFGEIEAFSLSGTKLVTGGEGGLLATTDGELVRKFEFLRNYGFYGDYNSLYVGLNGKVSELNAALACLTIDTIEAAIKRRNEIADMYREELQGVNGLAFQSIEKQSRCAYKDFGIRILKHRNRIERELAAKKIQTKRYFLPAHKMPAYFAYSKGPLPETERLYDEILCLPIFNEMDDAATMEVCKAIRESLR